MYDVFISHSSKDIETSTLITKQLENEEIKVWIAPRNVQAGKDYSEEIVSGIENSRIFLLILSKDSLNSKYVYHELVNAFELNKIIIPFRIDDSEVSGKWRFQLSPLHWISKSSLSSGRGFEELARIVKQYLDKECKENISEEMFVRNGSFQINKENSDDTPFSRKIVIDYDFYIEQYPVTFDLYDNFCASVKGEKPNDNNWGRGKRPVINVTWLDCIRYCNWLSEKSKLPLAYDQEGNLTDVTSKLRGYRLPTEAEWEYAAKGGNKSKGYLYSGSDDLNAVGWYLANSGDKPYIGEWNWEKIVAYNCQPHKTGLKIPNELDIYDMSGNVWEWCHDFYSNGFYEGSEIVNPVNLSPSLYRVVRGGSWGSFEVYSRSSCRGKYAPTYRDNALGFRTVRTV